MNQMNRLSRSFIFILLFGIAHTSFAYRYPLSDNSKKTIALAAAMSGLLCGGLGYAIHEFYLEDEHEVKDVTLWEKFCAFPWAAVVIPALVGAALVGCITYQYTPEKTLEWVENEVAKLEKNEDLTNAVKFECVNELKKRYIRESFPTLSLFDRLAALYIKLDSMKEHAQKVANSGIEGLKDTATICVDTIKQYEEMLYAWLLKIKGDQRYWVEVEMKSKMQAREALAAAAASRAEAEWAKAMNPHSARIILVKERYR